jgi:hypothetical protein
MCMKLLVPRYEEHEMLRTFNIIDDGEFVITGVRNRTIGAYCCVFPHLTSATVRHFGIGLSPLESRTAQTCFKKLLISQM